MQTRSSSRLVSNPSSNLTLSTNPNPKGRNRRCSKQRIEECNLDELSPRIVMMADQRTMAQLLQAPIEGYEDAIVVPAITADNFELKHGLLTLRFDESFSEAWDRIKDLLRACPHHGFSELHQFDTFYNALNSKDQDSLNSVAGGNFLDKMPCECLAIIESKSKVRYSRNKPVVAKVSTNTSTSGISPDVAELKDMVKALLLDKKSQNQAPATMKAVEESCLTCGGAYSYRNCPAIDGNVYRDNIQEFRNNQNRFNQNQNRGNNFNHGPVYQPPVFQPPAYQAPPYQALPPKTQGVSKEDFLAYVKANDAVMRNIASTSSSGTLPSNTIANPRSDLKEITTLSVSAPRPNQRPSIPYPSRFQDQKLRDKANDQQKLGDPGKFLIPYDCPRKAECLALADLGASINIMPLSVWNKLSLPDLTPTCMTLELTDRLISHLDGVAEDVYVKVDRKALIDVFEGESTLRVGKEAITFNLDQTSRYSANYNDMTAKRIDVIDMACEEYSQEVLGFSDVVASGNPTPYYDPVVSTTSLTLTPFGNSNFLLEEVHAFLALEDDPTSPEVDQSYLDPEGDILLLKAFLNDDPSLLPQNQENYLHEVRKELKICEAKFDKSSIDEPLEVKLKDVPPYLEYVFLEGDKKLLVIITKDLSVEEKTLYARLGLRIRNLELVPSFDSILQISTSWVKRLG
nr:reverse transcriptase domain-containing protein [Tanacetum cinerariifolium]